MVYGVSGSFALAEEHILFNVLEPDAIRENPDILSQYELVVIPGDVYLDNELNRLYDRYVASWQATGHAESFA